MQHQNARDVTPPATPTGPSHTLAIRTGVRAGTTIQIRPAKAPRFR